MTSFFRAIFRLSAILLLSANTFAHSSEPSAAIEQYQAELDKAVENQEVRRDARPLITQDHLLLKLFLYNNFVRTANTATQVLLVQGYAPDEGYDRTRVINELLATHESHALELFRTQLRAAINVEGKQDIVVVLPHFGGIYTRMANITHEAQVEFQNTKKRISHLYWTTPESLAYSLAHSSELPLDLHPRAALISPTATSTQGLFLLTHTLNTLGSTSPLSSTRLLVLRNPTDLDLRMWSALAIVAQSTKNSTKNKAWLNIHLGLGFQPQRMSVSDGLNMNDWRTLLEHDPSQFLLREMLPRNIKVTVSSADHPLQITELAFVDLANQPRLTANQEATGLQNSLDLVCESLRTTSSELVNARRTGFFQTLPHVDELQIERFMNEAGRMRNLCEQARNQNTVIERSRFRAK